MVRNSRRPRGGSVLGALTNPATAVSNGLFTVTLDFGAAVFTGADRWLEIGTPTAAADSRRSHSL